MVDVFGKWVLVWVEVDGVVVVVVECCVCCGDVGGL